MHFLVDANLPLAEELCRLAAAEQALTVATFHSRQPSAEQLASADVLWVRSVTRVDAALLQQAPKLAWVASGTIGTEHIDEAALAEAGVDFSHTPGVNAQAVGDYVLSGGELAAMVVVDAVVRLLDGALGDEDSAKNDSFSEGLLEYPHYTRPEVFRGMKVPEILLSGDHAKIAEWRRRQALERTKKWRPDLLKEIEKREN